MLPTKQIFDDTSHTHQINNNNIFEFRVKALNSYRKQQSKLFLQVPAGLASGSGSYATMLGQVGVNIITFCELFNTMTCIYKLGLLLNIYVIYNLANDKNNFTINISNINFSNIIFYKKVNLLVMAEYYNNYFSSFKDNLFSKINLMTVNTKVLTVPRIKKLITKKKINNILNNHIINTTLASFKSINIIDTIPGELELYDKVLKPKYLKLITNSYTISNPINLLANILKSNKINLFVSSILNKALNNVKNKKKKKIKHLKEKVFKGLSIKFLKKKLMMLIYIYSEKLNLSNIFINILITQLISLNTTTFLNIKNLQIFYLSLIRKFRASIESQFNIFF